MSKTRPWEEIRAELNDDIAEALKTMCPPGTCPPQLVVTMTGAEARRLLDGEGEGGDETE